jgi:hypothetical protein
VGPIWGLTYVELNELHVWHRGGGEEGRGGGLGGRVGGVAGAGFAGLYR